MASMTLFHITKSTPLGWSWGNNQGGRLSTRSGGALLKIRRTGVIVLLDGVGAMGKGATSNNTENENTKSPKEAEKPPFNWTTITGTQTKENAKKTKNDGEKDSLKVRNHQRTKRDKKKKKKPEGESFKRQRKGEKERGPPQAGGKAL